MEKNARAHVIISGRVQGVFYRVETRRAAEKIGVFGWVKNRMDGTVEAVIEGDKDRVKQLIEWCRVGPPAANVTNIDVRWEEYEGGFDAFTVRY